MGMPDGGAPCGGGPCTAWPGSTASARARYPSCGNTNSEGLQRQETDHLPFPHTTGNSAVSTKLVGTQKATPSAHPSKQKLIVCTPWSKKRRAALPTVSIATPWSAALLPTRRGALSMRDEPNRCSTSSSSRPSSSHPSTARITSPTCRSGWPGASSIWSTQSPKLQTEVSRPARRSALRRKRPRLNSLKESTSRGSEAALSNCAAGSPAVEPTRASAS